jgi:uncharacterized protein (DUF2267 family)
MAKDIVVNRVPMPTRLEPKQTSASLHMMVRGYFYSLFNSDNAEGEKFRDHLASVGNADSITKNKWFDRHVAVGMVKKAAKEAKDVMTLEADDGDVYKWISRELKARGLGPKERRLEYKRLN